MAWTAPRTWAAAELVTAANLNIHIRDNENFLHDCLLGAQDLGSAWKVQGTRDITWVGTGVNHGMTTLVSTDTYGALKNISTTAGGFDFEGYSDIDAVAARVLGIIGTTTPTIAPVAFFAAKKNGTGLQALASSELAFQFQNAGTAEVNIYGNGSLNVISGSVSVGFTGTASPGTVAVGDVNFYMSYIGAGDVRIVMDTGSDLIRYDRSGNVFEFWVGAATQLSIYSTFTQVNGILRSNDPLVNLGGGAAPTLGTIGGSGPAAAAQNKWFRMRDNTGADFWVPVWK